MPKPLHTPPPPVTRPSAHVRRAIAVEAVCEERSVERIYAGLPVRETTAVRVLAAIEKLGAPKPPTPVTR